MVDLKEVLEDIDHRLKHLIKVEEAAKGPVLEMSRLTSKFISSLPIYSQLVSNIDLKIDPMAPFSVDDAKKEMNDALVIIEEMYVEWKKVTGDISHGFAFMLKMEKDLDKIAVEIKEIDMSYIPHDISIAIHEIEVIEKQYVKLGIHDRLKILIRHCKELMKAIIADMSSLKKAVDSESKKEARSHMNGVGNVYRIYNLIKHEIGKYERNLYYFVNGVGDHARSIDSRIKTEIRTLERV